jgi:Domain of unknown function (DUF4157)
MERHDRKNGSPTQIAGSREPQRAPRPAPGKVTPASKVSPSHAPEVQRKALPTGVEGTPRQSRSLWDLTTDPWMDAAHRGGVALAERGPVQAHGRMDTENPDSVHRAAAAGVGGAGGALPHLDRIQEAFGGAHDMGQVRAHVGGQAAAASAQMGADAYATGNQIAFRSQPDLHTAAHVVQQRAGVQLQGGVGQVGHAGNADVEDNGYIHQPSFTELTEDEKLTNAAHFEVVPRRILSASFAFDGQTFVPAGTSFDMGAVGGARAQAGTGHGCRAAERSRRSQLRGSPLHRRRAHRGPRPRGRAPGLPRGAGARTARDRADHARIGPGLPGGAGLLLCLSCRRSPDLASDVPPATPAPGPDAQPAGEKPHVDLGPTLEPVAFSPGRYASAIQRNSQGTHARQRVREDSTASFLPGAGARWRRHRVSRLALLLVQ